MVVIWVALLWLHGWHHFGNMGGTIVVTMGGTIVVTWVALFR